MQNLWQTSVQLLPGGYRTALLWKRSHRHKLRNRSRRVVWYSFIDGLRSSWKIQAVIPFLLSMPYCSATVPQAQTVPWWFRKCSLSAASFRKWFHIRNHLPNKIGIYPTSAKQCMGNGRRIVVKKYPLLLKEKTAGWANYFSNISMFSKWHSALFCCIKYRFQVGDNNRIEKVLSLLKPKIWNGWANIFRIFTFQWYFSVLHKMRI